MSPGCRRSLELKVEPGARRQEGHVGRTGSAGTEGMRCDEIAKQSGHHAERCMWRSEQKCYWHVVVCDANGMEIGAGGEGVGKTRRGGKYLP